MPRIAILILCTAALLIPRTGQGSEEGRLPQGVMNFSTTGLPLEVSNTSYEFTTLSLQSPNVLIENREVDFEQYQVFSIEGEPFHFVEGVPSIPQINRLCRIPDLGGVELFITSAEYEVIENVNPLPMSFSGEGFEVPRDESIYLRDEWYPPQVALLSQPMILRDFRVACVTLYPVQVNPVTRQARIYHTLNVEVVANGQPSENEITVSRRPTGTWAPIYRSTISNLDESALDDATETPGTYLILCKTNNQAYQWADSLMRWKKRKGFDVRIEARDNWTPSSMRQFIQQRYADSTISPVEFVCLIGDPQWTYGVPTDDGGGYDHVFALAAGNDELEDLGVGRLSGDGSQMPTINAKIMGYERNPFMADTMWYHRGFFYASIVPPSGTPSTSNWNLMLWGGRQFAQWTGVNNNYVAWCTNHVDNNLVITRFNEGISYFFWRGIWLSQMENTLAGQTNPGWKLPVVMTITCGANEFVSGLGIAESYLVAGSPTQPRGGIAAMGTTTSGTHNPPNVTVAGGLIYAIANLGIEHLGNCVSSAKAWLALTFGPNSSEMVSFSRWNNLMGDPGLSLWTDVPVVISATHPATVAVGTRNMDITVRRPADNVPVRDALVVLWKRVGTSDETYVRGLTDAEGRITLPVTINTAGDLWLTVTKRNHKPYLATIPCVAQEGTIGLTSYTVGDQSGNGDGIPNPGEQIILPIYVRNFGATTAVTGISGTLASENPRVTVTQGTSAFGNLAPGDSSVSATPFVVNVTPAMQHRERALMTLTLTGSTGTSVNSFFLEAQAGKSKYISSAFSGSFDPGTTRQLTVTLRNIGVQPLTGAVGRITSLSPFVQVEDGSGAFGTIAPASNATNTADPFRLVANTLTFRGHQAPMLLITSTDNGHSDSVQFTVNVGTATTADPTGPDAYGYYAYDNTDASYEMHPTYSYVNISQGGGTELNLNDPGENLSVNTMYSVAVPLPFGFKYYGVVYDTVTICSNGWMAFGNQSYIEIFRNYPIPAMQAPDGMVAPYWDDLKTDGALGVWHQYDQTNHRYIVQWKAQVWQGGTNLDFEVILYDTTFHPTIDGNGQILFQYNQVTMNVPGDPGDVNGCSVGIQAPRGLVGLRYAYQASYTPGSAAVVPGRAILFTTNARMLFGTIQGTVRSARTNQPMPNVDVRIDGFSNHDLTDSLGFYVLNNVLIGTYNLRATRRGYNDAVATDILVQLDSTVTHDFSMTHPEFELSTDSIHVEVPTQPNIANFEIINNGDGPMDYNITIFYAGDESPNPWDSVASVPLSQLTGNPQMLGCEFVGDHWWVTASGGGLGNNLFYKFDLNGELAGTVLQPSATTLGWFDLAWDGQYLYGSDSHDLVGCDTNGVARVVIPSPMNPTRAVAYDPQSDHFWVADYIQDIYEIDRSGNIIQQIANAGAGQLAITGLAWHPQDTAGFKLYVFSRNGTTYRTTITRIHPVSHVRETVITLSGQPGDQAAGCAITPAWNSTLLVFGGVILNGNTARLGIYEMTFNTTWISVAPQAFVVPGGVRRDIEVRFDARALRPSTYRVNLRIHSQILDTTATLPVSLTVLATDAAPRELAGIVPTEYRLYQNYPNPFNPVTTIRYDLKSAGRTRLMVFNLLGEQVAELVNEHQAAGRYEVPFEASDLPSGVYFYRLEAGAFADVAKMVLMK